MIRTFAFTVLAALLTTHAASALTPQDHVVAEGGAEMMAQAMAYQTMCGDEATLSDVQKSQLVDNFMVTQYSYQQSMVMKSSQAIGDARSYAHDHVERLLRTTQRGIASNGCKNYAKLGEAVSKLSTGDSRQVYKKKYPKGYLPPRIKDEDVAKVFDRLKPQVPMPVVKR